MHFGKCGSLLLSFWCWNTHSEFPGRVAISKCEIVGGAVRDFDLVTKLKIEKFYFPVCLSVIHKNLWKFRTCIFPPQSLSHPASFLSSSSSPFLPFSSFLSVTTPPSHMHWPLHNSERDDHRVEQNMEQALTLMKMNSSWNCHSNSSNERKTIWGVGYPPLSHFPLIPSSYLPIAYTSCILFLKATTRFYLAVMWEIWEWPCILFFGCVHNWFLLPWYLRSCRFMSFVCVCVCVCAPHVLESSLFPIPPLLWREVMNNPDPNLSSPFL